MDLGGTPENLFYQSGDVFAVRPYAIEVYLALALLAPAAITGAALLRLVRSPDLRLSATAWYAGAATIGPLLALVLVTAFPALATWLPDVVITSVSPSG